jgi:hypothetical protein
VVQAAVEFFTAIQPNPKSVVNSLRSNDKKLHFAASAVERDKFKLRDLEIFGFKPVDITCIPEPHTSHTAYFPAQF